MSRALPLKIPPGPFEAYLFDCDGTIADSMPLHHRAWNAALAPWGTEFPPELFHAWAGIPVPRTVELLNERFHLSMPVEAVALERERIYLEFLPQIQPVRAVLAHIEEKRGILPMGVVSGSPKDSVLRTLATLGLTHDFAVILGAEDYARGKPYPDPFLLAAERIGVAPARCLVFEDGDPGIEAAKAAGMAWVKVPSALGKNNDGI